MRVDTIKVRACLATLLFFATTTLFAQPGDPPNPLPISGIEWLLAAGGLYGVKKFYDMRKRKP